MAGIGSAAIGTQKLKTGDIQIGTVEIKDASSDTRATVDVDGLHVSIQALTASDIDIRDLSSTQDSIEVIQDTAADLNCTEVNSLAIKNAVETIDNAISGNEMQVDLVGITPDLMLGTDFSNVLGTISLISGGAIKVAEQNTLTVTATDLDIRNLTATDVVTANLSTTDNAVLDDIQTAVELIDDAIIAQSTALGTTKQILIGGSVLSSAPTYTTGNIVPSFRASH